TLTVKNTSTVSESIGVRFGGFADDTISNVGTCGGALLVAPGKTCSLSLAITPHDGGTQTRLVYFFRRDENGNEIPGSARFVQVTLNGTAPPLSVTPTSIDFATVTQYESVTKVVTVKNGTKSQELVQLASANLDPSMTLRDGTSRCDVDAP